MKKLSLILLTSLLVGCSSSHIVLTQNGEEIYEGYGKAKPDFESPTFNIIIKEEGGDTLTFFGNDLHGFIEK